jgi:LAO/AO transport system kinase
VKHDLAAAVLAGDVRVLARALTLVENASAEVRLGADDAGADVAALQAAVAPRLGRAHRVGVTGPPGAGKSTLVSALISVWRKAARRVGVLAVDPSSPFTGGALLGDRVRMTQHLGDAGVFVRSLAARGAAGGLAAAAEDMADLLDAAGFDPVVLETVGVGQGELEVAGAADTTVLVLAPGGGDDIQALKAGVLEAADVVVVNQADRAGADRLEAALKAAFELRQTGMGGVRQAPPCLATVATTGVGVEALAATIDARAAGGPAAFQARRVARAARRVRAAVERRLHREFWGSREAELARLAGEVASGRLSAGEAVRGLVGAERVSEGGR